MVEISKGNILIGNELFYPNYSFDQFKKSKFYINQDGVRQIKLNGIQQIWEHYFIVNLIFRKNKLYSISLYCVDDKSLFDEKLLKQKHDKILNQLGLKELTRFDWGYIESYYEQNSASSIIGIYYK
ncbi:hypothetical protein [uncultured Treponema sp.]|uniref:hypothetical protein n=1 Tax=uncultured Treponema sp. TaxID=162155 RepID=UPI0025916020|nr:hypothetical protein [uncultured Treponema sp.]